MNNNRPPAPKSRKWLMRNNKSSLSGLTGQNVVNDVTRELMALPVRLGGLGITNPSADTPSHHDASMKITTRLTALIMDQSHQYPNTTKAEQIRIKKESVKAKKQCQSQAAAELKDKLPNSLRRPYKQQLSTTLLHATTLLQAHCLPVKI